MVARTSLTRLQFRQRKNGWHWQKYISGRKSPSVTTFLMFVTGIHQPVVVA